MGFLFFFPGQVPTPGHEDRHNEKSEARIWTVPLVVFFLPGNDSGRRVGGSPVGGGVIFFNGGATVRLGGAGDGESPLNTGGYGRSFSRVARINSTASRSFEMCASYGGRLSISWNRWAIAWIRWGVQRSWKWFGILGRTEGSGVSQGRRVGVVALLSSAGLSSVPVNPPSNPPPIASP